ncbi:MAG TPA: undecaprenyl-diphosphatase UppP [Gemmataceae bacterium]
MSAWQALVLGFFQGLTEFLPVSSTAHLRVVPALLGWDDPGAAFTAVVQIGTLLAVLLYFRADVARLTAAFLRGLREGDPWGSADAKQAWMIALGTVPIVVCGVLFKDDIETTLRSLYVVAGALIGLALLLLFAELWGLRRRARGVAGRGLGELGWWDAVVVGLFQAAALVPGASRSGVTITGGLFRNMTRETAARFSFLLSLPSVLAAGVYELYTERAVLLASRADLGNLLIATAASFAVGYASIAFLLSFLRRHTTGVFIAYRLLLGGLILYLLAAGTLTEF